MSPVARVGGVALSVVAHVGAGALLLTLSVADWTPGTSGAREAGAGSRSGGEMRGDGGVPGSALALGTPGPGAGTIPAEYGPYLLRFRQRVQESLVYPLAARRQGLRGSVEL